MTRQRCFSSACGLLMLLTAAGCGGGSDGPTTPTPTSAPTPTTTTTTTATGGNPNEPVATTTITITAAGVSPRRILVSPGARVTFINNDTRSHEMNSDPHPEHGDCPGIDNISFIAAGQTKVTGNLTQVRTCGYHDHNLPTNTSLQGQIIVR